MSYEVGIIIAYKVGLTRIRRNSVRKKKEMCMNEFQVEMGTKGLRTCKIKNTFFIFGLPFNALYVQRLTQSDGGGLNMS